MATDQDRKFMTRALELAGMGRGRVSPNPMVGCVVVRDGRVIGEGYHERAGRPHAEVRALEQAKDTAGATLYVNLEPCCHEGRTGPCTDVIIRHKPARVVAAMQDPNPRVSGTGFERLRAAGIEVEVGVMEDEARRLNEVFVKYIVTGIPFVIAKCAMSLDGKIATRTGDSRWISGETSREMVHRLRNEVDAVLVGSRTVMLDDPSLTTRLEHGKIKDPVRIILDADSYLDPRAHVFHTHSTAPTWVAVPDDVTFEHADETIHIPRGRTGMDMRLLMLELGSRQIASVLIEGGGTTLASAFEGRVVDKVYFFVAPKIIGGRDAITAVEGEGAARIADALPLHRMRAVPVGEDLLIEAYVRKDLTGEI